MPFQKFGLPSPLLHNLRTLGYVNPTPIQTQAIPAVRSGRDLVATAQTGSGKTAAFLLPVLDHLLRRPRGPAGALVLAPTRELAQQIDGCFRRLAAGTPLRSALVTGGVPEAPQLRVIRGGVDLVVATPGRLLAHLRSGCGLPAVGTLVLDEADQMFDLGFLPDVKRIVGLLPARRQTLLFSATMPPEVERLSRALLRDPMKVSVGVQGTPAPSVSQSVYPVPSHRKAPLLEHLLEQMDAPSVLVFTRTKHGARRLARHLNEAGHDAAELHSDRTPAQRSRAMQGFRDRAFTILVATNIAARGLDVRHVTHVVSFDVPATSEEHVHRIGRTGRAGDKGHALVLSSPEESATLERIERKVGRLPRVRVPDFDYNAAPAKRRTPVSGGRPSGRSKAPSGRAARGKAMRGWR
jgi:ATP-dependent RNA helicase RhlE